jgi:hypothetical protein
MALTWSPRRTRIYHGDAFVFIENGAGSLEGGLGKLGIAHALNGLVQLASNRRSIAGTLCSRRGI